MEDEEPLRIAILGSGPIGLEAALYGRYLGYVVTLFDDQDVCAAMARDETSLGSAFRGHCTPLGLAALDAQDATNQCPDADQVLSIGQWMVRYCVPLSRTDLLRETLRMGWTVQSIDFEADNETYQLIATRRDAPAVNETFDYIIDTRSFRFLTDEKTTSQEFSARKTDDFFTVDTDQDSFDFLGAADAIRRVYATIGERDDLNVYETLKQFQI